MSSPCQPPLSGVLISPIAPYVMWRICVDHIQLYEPSRQLPSETKVAIMPTNIRLVIIETICSGLRSWAFSEGDDENYWSVTRCHLKSSMPCSCEQESYPGAARWGWGRGGMGYQWNGCSVGANLGANQMVDAWCAPVWSCCSATRKFEHEFDHVPSNSEGFRVL